VGIAALDPAVLAAGAESLEAALDPFAGEPTLVVVANLADTDVACTSAALTALRQVAMLTVGVDAPSPLAPCFDLVVTADELPRVRAAFERSPRASVAAALLVRTPPPDIWTGLVAESATYSALQAGPEFIAWRRGRPVHPPSPHDDAPRVRLSDRDGVLEIVLTRPFKHNALDRRMRDELFEALTAARARDRGAVVLRADGPSFCSGGDLDEFGSFPDPATAHVIRLSRSPAWRCAQLSERLVVGIHGACLGAGTELPAFAARVVAADDARIGLPELGLGLVPGAGGTVSIPRRSSSSRLLDLLLRDGTIDAPTAHEWGIVDEVVPRSSLEDRLFEIAATMESK